MTLDQILETNISPVEYYKANMELKNGKSSGWDDITNEFIKYGGEELDEVLRDIFQKMIETEYIPPNWKGDKLIMLYKKGNKDKCENYRGLAMSSNMLKLFSRIIHTEGDDVCRTK